MVTFTMACWYSSVGSVSSTPAGLTVFGFWARACLTGWVAFVVVFVAGVPVGVEVVDGASFFASWVAVLTLVVLPVLVVVTAV